LTGAALDFGLTLPLVLPFKLFSKIAARVSDDERESARVIADHISNDETETRLCLPIHFHSSDELGNRKLGSGRWAAMFSPG